MYGVRWTARENPPSRRFRQARGGWWATFSAGPVASTKLKDLAGRATVRLAVRLPDLRQLGRIVK